MKTSWTDLLNRNRPAAAKFVLALTIGLALEIILALFPVPGLKAVRQAGDDMADGLMRFAALSETAGASPLRFAFIDIDDATWAAWGAPLVTPRDRLVEILGPVARSRPAVIVLDVDLAFRDAETSEIALKKFLGAYPPEAPPLVLARALMPGAQTGLPSPRGTEFEKEAHKPNIIWALPSFLRDSDGNVRRWQLAFPVCEGGAPKIIASAQLAAAWLWSGNGADALAPALAPLVPKDCGTADAGKGPAFELAEGKLPAIIFNGSDAASRVIYSIKWQDRSAALGPELADGSFKVAVRKAGTVARLDEGGPVPGIEGAIAVIGGSFKDSGDWHDTPIGAMPGSLVLINAIDALARHGTPNEQSWITRLALSLLMICAACLCVAIFRPSVAALMSLLGFGLLMAASMPLFKSGLVLNLAIPSLGIILADALFSFAETICDMRKEGWRWMFKPAAAPSRRRKERS